MPRARSRYASTPSGTQPSSYLLFSGPNANTIYRWSETDGLSVYRAKSGYAGIDVGEYGQPGSNGLTLDALGRLTTAEHGRRRIASLERNGVVTLLADRREGRRLNSPNDLTYRSDGGSRRRSARGRGLLPEPQASRSTTAFSRRRTKARFIGG